MDELYRRLIKKGYTKKEALQTIKVIKRAKQNKPFFIRFLDAIIYWFVLLVAIVGNLVIAIILIPFLLAFKRFPLYITVILLAVMFGFLFDQLIIDMENLKKKHYIIAWIFIPVLAVINTYYMTSFANYLTTTLPFSASIRSPVVVSLVYVIGFMVPYSIRSLIETSHHI